MDMTEEPREIELTRFPDDGTRFILHYTRRDPGDGGIPIFTCGECGMQGNWTKFQGHIFKTHSQPPKVRT